MLLGVGLAASALLAVFFINLVSFRLRVHQPFAYLYFGQLGLRPFVANFPWLLLALAGGGFVGGIILLKKYDISYKYKFSHLVIGLILAVLFLGTLIDQIGLNERMEKFQQIPFYKKDLVGRNWLVGDIVKVSRDGMKVTGLDEKQIQVLFEKEAKIPLGVDFQVGQRIRLVGYWRGEEFVAKGLMPASPRKNQESS